MRHRCKCAMMRASLSYSGYLGYQHTIDIHAAPNETPSRSNFDSRFKIARPTVNMSSSMANPRSPDPGKRNIRTRYAFHSMTHFSIAENQTLFFLTHVPLVYFNLLRSISVFLSLSPPPPFSLFSLPLSLSLSPLPFSIPISFAAAASAGRGVFAPSTFKHHGVTSLPTLTRERSCPECNVFGDS